MNSIYNIYIHHITRPKCHVRSLLSIHFHFYFAIFSTKYNKSERYIDLHAYENVKCEMKPDECLDVQVHIILVVFSFSVKCEKSVLLNCV